MEEKMSSQPNKEIICQHISLYSRMVLVEEKNLTRAYQIRQFQNVMHPLPPHPHCEILDDLQLSICQTFVFNMVQTIQP